MMSLLSDLSITRGDMPAAGRIYDTDGSSGSGRRQHRSASWGLRAGSGFTIGVVGAFIGVELSLTLSATMVVLSALGLLVADARRRPSRVST